jgi:hypothetical protein
MQPELLDTLYAKVYAVYKAQLNHWFIFALSITDFVLQISLFDHSEALHSLSYNIHKMPVTLMGILSGSIYLSATNLGYDPTVVLPRIPHHLILVLSQTIPSTKVSDKIYHIISPFLQKPPCTGMSKTQTHVMTLSSEANSLRACSDTDIWMKFWNIDHAISLALSWMLVRA